MFEKSYCSPALFLFPPKSFFLLEWFWSFSCGRLSFRIRQPLVVHSHWRLKSTQSDLWVCFEARGQGLSAGEFHWQRPGSVPASSGWEPQMTFSAGFFSPCSHSVPPGQNPCCPARKEDAGCQQREGLRGRISTFLWWLQYWFSLSPGTSPELLSCPLLYVTWLYSESFWFRTSGKKLPGDASRWQRKGGGRHCLVAWVGEHTWGSRPKLPNNVHI